MKDNAAEKNVTVALEAALYIFHSHPDLSYAGVVGVLYAMLNTLSNNATTFTSDQQQLLQAITHELRRLR